MLCVPVRFPHTVYWCTLLRRLTNIGKNWTCITDIQSLMKERGDNYRWYLYLIRMRWRWGKGRSHEWESEMQKDSFMFKWKNEYILDVAVPLSPTFSNYPIIMQGGSFENNPSFHPFSSAYWVQGHGVGRLEPILAVIEWEHSSGLHWIYAL